MEKRNFPVLDGLRGLAAIVIVTRHSSDRSFDLIFPGGYLAVDLFFALSGFVLAYNYLPRFRRGLSPGRFLRLRFVRLFPLYALGTAIGIAARLFNADAAHPATFRWIGAIAANLMFIPAVGPIAIDRTAIFPFDNPGWSLFYELLVNAIFASVALKLTARSLVPACILFAILLIGADLSAGALTGGACPNEFYAGISRVSFSFFAGVLIHRIYVRMPARGATSSLIPMAGMLLVFILPAVGHARALHDAASVIVLFPLILCCALYGDPGPKLASVFRVMGTASYGVYILHLPLLLALNLLVPDAETWLGPWTPLAVVSIAFGAAVLLDKYYDRPVRTWLASSSARRSPGRDPAAAATVSPARDRMAVDSLA